ncbi:MAG TPA: nucleoside monophosphate kinase [bacterium]|nr:nucleoside monophosphate kinase [bacterium]
MNLILIGIQGSGKGTQAAKILERYDCVGFDTGRALREFAEGDSDEAREVDAILKAGKLVPTRVVAMVVRDFVERAGDTTILFDSVIRSAEQNDALGDIVGCDAAVLYFHLDEETAIRRLLGRKIDPVTKEVFGPEMDVNPKTGNTLVHRSDDTLDAIKSRLEWSKKDTLPVLDIWRKEGRTIHTVDASQSPDEVFVDLCEILDPIMPIR